MKANTHTEKYLEAVAKKQVRNHEECHKATLQKLEELLNTIKRNEGITHAVAGEIAIYPFKIKRNSPYSLEKAKEIRSLLKEMKKFTKEGDVAKEDIEDALECLPKQST